MTNIQHPPTSPASPPRAAARSPAAAAEAGPSSPVAQVPMDFFGTPPSSPAGLPRLGGANLVPPTPTRKRRRGGEPAPWLAYVPSVELLRLVSRSPLTLREWRLPSGKHLFVEGHKLGRGSFGHVIAAVGADGQLYAIKQNVVHGLPSPSKTRVTRAYDRIAHEHTMTQQFCWPQSEFFRSDSDISWTMPLRAGTLEDLVKALGSAQTRELAPNTLWQLLGLLETMHTAEHAHGDLKPDNLLLSMEATLELGDMGSARPFGMGGDSDLGEFNRRAPEQANIMSNEHPVNASTDMWSAGIVIWEMAAGQENSFCTDRQDYVVWHGQQPMTPDGRIDVSRVRAEGRWGTLVREMEDGTPTKAALPGLANVLVNDMTHPDATRRATAANLRSRLPPAWAEAAPALQEERERAVADLPAAVRGRALQEWAEAHQQDGGA